MNDVAWCFVYFQYTPNDKAELKGILTIEEEKIYFVNEKEKKELKSNALLTETAEEILPTRPTAYLKQLSLQSSISQITYEYTEDFNRVSEYLSAL